jgi:predicted nicotinamide N-methyase
MTLISSVNDLQQQQTCAPNFTLEECTAQKNLELVSQDAALQGWSNIFQGDNSDDEEEKQEEMPFSPIGMQGFTLNFTDAGISLSLLQALSAFSASGSGADDTGLVLWGASVTLAQYLVRNHPQIVQHKTVMELGCGGAVPSLVACHLGASQVISTDFRQATLDHVRYHAEQNKCDLTAHLIDWEDPNKVLRKDVDVLLAADVIYGVSLVPPLVMTIEKYLAKDGTLVIATRDGRRGIAEFLQLMKEKFVLVASESHNETYLPLIPKEMESNEICRGRWIGNHSIYSFRWRTPDELLSS